MVEIIASFSRAELAPTGEIFASFSRAELPPTISIFAGFSRVELTPTGEIFAGNSRLTPLLRGLQKTSRHLSGCFGVDIKWNNQSLAESALGPFSRPMLSPETPPSRCQKKVGAGCCCPPISAMVLVSNKRPLTITIAVSAVA